MKRSMRVILAGVVIATLLVALVGAGLSANVALAQGPAPAPSAPTGTPPTNPIEQSFWQALAARLGITLDRLTQGVKDAAKDTIATALQNGTITQEQADRATQRADQWQPGQGLPFGRGGHRGPGGHGPKGIGGLDTVAQALGMTGADLMTELRAGKTLAEVAQAKGVSQDAIKNAIVSAKKAEIDAAVAAGRLTAEQAAQMKTRIDQEAANFDLNNLFRGRGGLEGGPKPFGPGRSAPGLTPRTPGQSPAAPSSPSGA